MSATVGRRVEGGLPARVAPVINAHDVYLVGRKPLRHGNAVLQPGEVVPRDLLEQLPRPETFLQLRMIVPAGSDWQLPAGVAPVGDVPAAPVQTVAQAMTPAKVKRKSPDGDAPPVNRALVADPDEAALVAAAQARKAAMVGALGLKSDTELEAERVAAAAEVGGTVEAVSKDTLADVPGEEEPPDDE